MKKHIVCLGDSNTHGYCADPNDCADHGDRFNENERWTQLLQRGLGDDYLVIEEGLSGRTTCFADPLHEGLDALSYITPCLMSHERVDLLVIMLGTNDSKDRFHVSAKEIAIALGRLIDKARATPCWGKHAPNILVVAPPPIGERIVEDEVFRYTMGRNCHAVTAGLAKEYADLCKQLNIHFVDAVSYGCEFNAIDWTHLTREAHSKLADGLSRLIPTLL